MFIFSKYAHWLAIICKFPFFVSYIVELSLVQIYKINEIFSIDYEENDDDDDDDDDDNEVSMVSML